MSTRLLNGVVLVPSPIEACLSCRGIVTPRKVDVYYLADARQTNGVSACLPADVWYCQRCDNGFVLSAFKQVTDSLNRKWFIKELSSQLKPQPRQQQHGNHQQPTKQQVGSTSVARTQIAKKTPLRVKAIDFILQDHENKCPSCKAVVAKVDVQIQIVKGEQIEYTPCSALKCEYCGRWMLRKHHYIAMQTNLQPYMIPLASTAKKPSSILSAGKPQKSKKSKQSNAGAVRKKVPADLGTPPVKREPPRSRLFNQYGVFLPSPTGRSGYFED